MIDNSTVMLNLDDLRNGIPALTPALGCVHAECASVCLDHNNHPLAVRLSTDKSNETQFAVQRQPVSPQMRDAYNDMQRSTELGACGIAILLVREVTGLTAILQARKGGGFDYWVAPAEQPTNSLPFQNAARLEVSGILKGDSKKFATRMKQKLDQSKPSDGTRLPAYAVVVEFGEPKAEVAQRC